MKAQEWLNTEMFKVIGWTLIHSLWQFLALFALLKVLLLIVNKSNSRLRYLAGVLVLSVSVICSTVTFYREYKLFFGQDVQTITAAAQPLKNSPVHQTNNDNATVLVAPAPGMVLINVLNTITPYLTFGWILGMLIYALKFMNSAFYMNKLRRLKTEVYPEITRKLTEIRDKMQIEKAVRLIISDQVTEALTFGFFKPVILLPCSVAMQVPMEQLEMILAHELAHTKRYDYLVNLVQTALEVVYFFNPFFKAMSAIIRDEREYCSDDMAANYCGDPTTMAITLANLAILTRRPGLALPAAPTKNTFRTRINRLIGQDTVQKSSVKNSLSTFVIVILTLLLLTKCAYDNKQNNMLPVVTDQLSQLLTDNQANYKEQVFTYQRGDESHEIFLVSTVNGKPLYAYLDGTLASEDQFTRINKFLQKKRTLSPDEMKKIQKDELANRGNSVWELSATVDSLNNLTKQTKTALATNPSSALKDKLDKLNKQTAAKNDLLKKISMNNYRAEVESIPFDVKLHVLLTKIIVSKAYTPTDRAELIELIKKRGEAATAART